MFVNYNFGISLRCLNVMGQYLKYCEEFGIQDDQRLVIGLYFVLGIVVRMILGGFGCLVRLEWRVWCFWFK